MRHAGLFHVWKDGKVWAVPPDKVEGIFEAIEARFREMRDWSLLDGSRDGERKAWDHVYRLRRELAEAERKLKLFSTSTDTQFVVEEIVRKWWHNKVQKRNQIGRYRGQSGEYRLLRDLTDDLASLIGRPLPTVVKERMKRSIWHLRYKRRQKVAKEGNQS